MSTVKSLEGNNLRNQQIPLNIGTFSIPALGFGTLIPDPVATKSATKAALKTGFRAFDSAERYRTEKEVGEAIREVIDEKAVTREQLFVATKLWNNNHRPDLVRPALDRSLQRLGLDYVDLYLIHTPFAFRAGDDQDPRDANGALIYDEETSLLDTWHAMEQLIGDGRCRAIGLSDCDLNTVRTIYQAASVKPSVVQVEAHPYNPEWDLLNYCKENGIVLQAFAPLGHSLTPRLLDDSVVVGIAQRLNKTASQVLLAWAVQRGTALLTTSRNASRIEENLQVSAIPQDAMEAINAISTRVRFNSVVTTGVPGFIPRGR